MLQWAQIVALAILRTVNVAVDSKDLIGSVIYCGVADKWTTHIVIFNIPEATHLNPLLAIYNYRAVEWAERSSVRWYQQCRRCCNFG